MKYFSIDIETTGLDKYRHQVLQIGIVFEDTEKNIPVEDLPYKEFYINQGDLTFSEYALQMHVDSGLLDEYFAVEKVYMREAVDELCAWFKELGIKQNETDGRYEIVVAGKNYNAFDRQFLHEFYSWDMNIKEHRRVLDPTLFYVDWEDDITPPSLSICLNRADLDDEVSHDAIEDARDVIRLIRLTRSPYLFHRGGT